LRILPALFAMFLGTSVLAYAYCLPVELDEQVGQTIRTRPFSIVDRRSSNGPKFPMVRPRCGSISFETADKPLKWLDVTLSIFSKFALKSLDNQFSRRRPIIGRARMNFGWLWC